MAARWGTGSRRSKAGRRVPDDKGNGHVRGAVRFARRVRSADAWARRATQRALGRRWLATANEAQRNLGLVGELLCSRGPGGGD